MPGRLKVVLPDGHRFRRNDEKPAARHREHHVPDEPRHREGHLEAPEAVPGREAIASGHLVEVGRHGAKRLVEAEGHVPGLAREDGEDGGALRTELAAREEAQEEDDGEGDEAQDRDRLEDVEDRDEDELGPPALGGEGGVGEGEDERGQERCQHAQRRQEGVQGERSRVEGDGMPLDPDQRLAHVLHAKSDQHEGGQDQRRRRQIPAVRHEPPTLDSDDRRLLHGASRRCGPLSGPGSVQRSRSGAATGAPRGRSYARLLVRGKPPAPRCPALARGAAQEARPPDDPPPRAGRAWGAEMAKPLDTQERGPPWSG